MAASMKMVVFWGDMPCQTSERNFLSHYQGGEYQVLSS
jgi:hypothetical protein